MLVPRSCLSDIASTTTEELLAPQTNVYPDATDEADTTEAFLSSEWICR